MRLKTLEIKGFKSFANETAIHFNEDVIGIVGPNGSGKSNVVDAIRWVLGEQKSAELRLDKMNSVIFNGTKKRKAGQLAQVSLTFENTKNLLPTEYSAVTITRILYASGESEYRLNGVTCRLKDITSLFMDTGIGSNSYAIIALGMVDDILNDKQNSRRMMFEQAAGVSKYKARKHETLNKLNATQEDLTRVEDLLFEISNNLKSLEKQAKRTQRFFDLKAEYKAIAVDLAVLKLSVFKNDYKNLEKQITADTDRYRQLDIDATKMEVEIEKEKTVIIEQEQSLSEKQRELNQTVGRLRGLENDKKMAQQRLLFIEQNNQKLAQQATQFQAQIKHLDEELDFYTSEVAQEKRLEAKLEEQLEEAKQKLDDVRNNHGSLKADLDVFIQKLQTVEREIVELEKQKAIAQNQIDNLKRDITRTDDETSGRRNEVKILKEKLVELDTNIEILRKERENLEENEEKRLAKIEKATAEQDDLTKKLQDENRKLDALKNEFKLTKSMLESMEGFPESIKFLANEKNWKKTPLLGDLIYVQEKYRTAIENYLEPYLNYFVVENVAEAQHAIHLLTNAQKGKANFFILDAFDKNYDTTALLNAQAAIDVVQIDDNYKRLFSYLLHNVLIPDTESIDYQSNTEGYVFLGASGSTIRRKHSLTGGSVGLFEGKKIGRKKNLEILETQIKEIETNATELSKQLVQVRADISFLKNSDAKKEIQAKIDAFNHKNQERVFTQTRMDNFAAFLSEADTRKENFEKRIKEEDVKIGECEKNLALKKIDSEAIKAQMSAADGSYRNISDMMSQLSANYNTKNLDFVKQQNKVSTLQRELSFRQRQRQDTEGGIATAKKQLEQATEELELVKDEIVHFDTELQELYKKRREREGGLGSFEQAFYKRKNDINQLEEHVRRLNRQRNELQSQINNLKDKFTDIKLQISSIGERLQVEFAIAVNDVINETPKEGLNREELQKRVDTLKRQLDTYGEINPLAVEAYNEIKERHDTIVAQRDDILQAKDALLETIKEIEETATTQFMETFNTVRLYFIDIFKTLFFEEDTADLILTDPENPLESGISIMAKPKGKRPQSISQLSGGEKTLTATALLFALYLYKPAPFCIFDEVDAPLDDANIEKFNKIIRKFSKDSQFIIVTHNKATMAAVDVIYGVHMPEQGISEVTPVDFRSFGNTVQFEAAKKN